MPAALVKYFPELTHTRSDVPDILDELDRRDRLDQL
jgi:hypothetical protein